jgi:hypothetical protein
MSVTVITANGDFTIPSGQSWGCQFGPDGSVLVTVHDGPFTEVQPPAGTTEFYLPVSAATGTVVGQFDEVEAVYPTNSVTKS